MRCLNDGALQAYLDRELPPAGMRRADGHFAVCPACRNRLARVETAAARVHGWLDSLAPEDLPAACFAPPAVAERPAGSRLRWAALALAGVLAAVLLIAVTFRHPPAPPPIAKKAPAVQPAPVRVSQTRPVAAKPKAGRARRPGPRPSMDGFLPLGNADPIQVGMVVRVMLPASELGLAPQPGAPQEIAADVVIGEDGRPRAIRFLE